MTLQVKDPQQVFDELVLPMLGKDTPPNVLNTFYQIFVLGEMYGTVSTSLAQEIPIPKELWENSTVQQFVMGDVVDARKEHLEKVADIVRKEIVGIDIEVFG